jgi:predicted RNA-binding protein with PIN domain
MGPQKGSPHYIVDGYNVIFHGGYATPKSGSSNGRIADYRHNFLSSLSQYVKKKAVRITVVWDGGSSTSHPRSKTVDGVQNIYTPHGLSADEHIVRMVEKRSNPRELTVVSDDRRHIVSVVRHLGAQTMGVPQFLSLVGNGRKLKTARGSASVQRSGTDEQDEKKEANDLSVDDWLELFQVKETGNRNET